MDQADIGKSSRRGGRLIWLWTALSIFSAWATLFLFWPLALVLLALGSTLAFARSKKAGVWSLCLSPLGMPILFFAVGVVTYLMGAGRLMSSGLPSAGFYNLDPDYRCYRSTWGCVVHGWEPLAQIPNNVAIRAMTSIFGPMRGTYHGPYPSRQEALKALNTPRGHLQVGNLRPQATDFGVPSASIERLDQDLGGWYRKGEEISFASFQEQTTILGGERCVFLVDRKTGIRYALYVFQGPSWQLTSGAADRAIAGYTHAIEVNPQNPEYYLERGEVYLRMRDFENASNDFKKALAVAPPDWWRRSDAELGLQKATAR